MYRNRDPRLQVDEWFSLYVHRGGRKPHSFFQVQMKITEIF